jgi:hypothetical protein
MNTVHIFMASPLRDDPADRGSRGEFRGDGGSGPYFSTSSRAYFLPTTSRYLLRSS